MIGEKVLYVVNNDTTTGIALEVAEFINQKHPDFQTVVYYKSSPYPAFSSKLELLNISARFFFDLNALKKAYQLIKEYQPTVIHGHHTISALVFFVLGRVACPNSKLIKTVHSSHKSHRWTQRFINFFIYLLADKLLCNSESTKKSFPVFYRYFFYHKTEVCYNGINIQKVRDAGSLKGDAFGGKDEISVLGSVGRLISVKDYKTLIKAFSNLRKKSTKNLKLILVGDGNERKKLEKLVERTGLGEDIIFTGAVDRQLVYSYLKQMDVFVITSLHEGFCNALVEALAAGKAIVCSEIETLKEVAGDAAIFARVGNPESFSTQISRLIESDGLSKEMKKRANRRAEKFTIESCAERYMKHYN